MRYGLFVGSNRVAREFVRLVRHTRHRPVAIFTPAFANERVRTQSSKQKQPDFAVTHRCLSDDTWIWEKDQHSLADCPVIPAGSLDSSVELAVKRFGLELIVSVCFPRKLPQAVLATAGSGGLNLHPSPLPAWRGIDPIFWQLRAGCTEIGLSLHRMNNRFDAGEVIARDQISLSLIDGMAALDGCIASSGVGLLSNVLDSGSVAEGSHKLTTSAAVGRSFPAPCLADYRFWSTWSCAHVRRFVGFMHVRGVPFYMSHSGSILQVNELFDPNIHSVNSRLLVDMVDGVVAFARGR